MFNSHLIIGFSLYVWHRSSFLVFQKQNGSHLTISFSIGQ